jgi:hypothetical protein
MGHHQERESDNQVLNKLIDMKRIGLILFLLMLASSAYAQLVPFEVIRTALDGKNVARVDNDIMITGYVINSQGNSNLQHNPQHATRYTEVNLKAIRKVMYIESQDARYGFKLEFETPEDAKTLKRYALATLKLNGTMVRKEDGGYVISGLTREHVMSQTEGTAETFPRKIKSISEVTSDDIFTYVTLTDCEFVFKDGAYVNVHELYTVKTEKNQHCRANGMMDGWGTLICDKTGTPAYMMLNSSCLWRRDGKGVPQGSGTLSGIVTDTPNARYYGADVERALQIRPMNRKDIAMSEPSCWDSICEWNWSDNVRTIRTLSGNLENVTKEVVVADSGKGELSFEVEGSVTRRKEPNHPALDSKEKGQEDGVYAYGAINMSAASCNWWDWKENRGLGLVLNFSTKGIKGKNLILAFSFAAGNGKPDRSLGYPVYWCVEYSLDGINYKRVDDTEYVLNTLPYWRENDVYGVSYPTSLECGLGFTEHILNLPAELFGQKEVYVRIIPSQKKVGSMAFTDRDKVAMRPELDVLTNVSFGSVAVRYNR